MELKTPAWLGEPDAVQWLQFYYAPLSYAHPSWWEALKTRVAMPVPVSNHSRLQAWALNRWELPPVDDFDYAHPAKSLALFSRSQLLALVRYLGLCLYAHSIRSLLWRLQQQYIKEAVGQSGYQFVIHRVPLLLSDWPPGFQQTWAPCACSGEAIGQLDRGGMCVVATLFQDSPIAYRRRLLLKLPNALSTEMIPLSYSSRDKQPVIYRLVQKVVRQMIPECTHLLK